MNQEHDPAGQADPRPTDTQVLERITAAVLLIVLVAVGGMVLAAYRPEWADWLSQEVEVIAVLVLLLAALLLVSMVALRHTRS
jgi:hypothetical protein